MEEEVKYYTPTLEEFRVGFKYEFIHPDYKEYGWNKYSSPEFNPELEDCIFSNDIKYFRVKYLDASDIESLGFICTGENSDGIEFQKIIDNYKFYDIYFDPEDNNKVVIEEFYQDKLCATEMGSYNSHTIFNGVIKNISELKVLFTQLGIKYEE